MNARHDDAIHDPVGRSSRTIGGVGSGLLVVGATLVVLGLWAALRVLDVLPPDVVEIAGDWWAVLPLAAGLWLLMRGRRVTGLVLTLVSVAVLLSRTVADGLFWPALLIIAGIMVLLAATGSRRWFLDGSGMSLFSDRDVELTADGGSRSLTSLFGEVRGQVDEHEPGSRPIECLALFGSVTLTVPRDVPIEVRQLTVFGEVGGPAGRAVDDTRPPIEVTATAVFGEVQIRRA